MLGKESNRSMNVKVLSFILTFLIVLSLLSLDPAACRALTAEQVVVVANKNAWDSGELAEYYMKKRNIPSENLIRLKAPSDEDCSREDYEQYIASPIRAFLKKNDPEGDRFRCLVTMYGIPLRIHSPQQNSEGKKRLLDLKKQYESITTQIHQAELQKNEAELKVLREAKAQIGRQMDQSGMISQGAAVDSELALVREDSYRLEGWLPNKYFLGYRGQEIKNRGEKGLWVSRLDGPSEDIVRRIINDSLYTEEKRLSGRAYFDARWPDSSDKPDFTAGPGAGGFAFYDQAIHNAARIVGKNDRLPVIIDSKETLFQPGQCPDAALYCGWYSVGRYVDAFTWVRGAVGYHIASAECTTLKDKRSQVWCKVMLEKGIAATLGPVAEPYVQAFPLPDAFFGLLVKSHMTLGEAYALSNPFWSWQMVLIGDPLYRPFKK